jgi:aspartate/methionine/tyrosine aminotransferase
MEIYRDHTNENLLEFYIEAREAGATILCDEIWSELLFRERKESKEGLAELRDKLNQVIEEEKLSKKEIIIGC